jgi:hypothetical protein
MLVSPRKPSSTILASLSAEYFLRLSRRRVRTVASTPHSALPSGFAILEERKACPGKQLVMSPLAR